MYFCDERKLVYIRVPKTGSTTFVDGCGFWKRSGPDHGTLRESVEEDGWERRSGYKVITIIRRPLDWLMSMYKMSFRAAPHWNEYVGVGSQFVEDSFDTFLMNLHVTQLDWVTIDGEICADEIWTTDDIYQKVQELGISNPIEKKNETKEVEGLKGRDLTWTEGRVAIARERFPREFAFFDRAINGKGEG